MSPRYKEICSFFPQPQFKGVLGFEPGADQLLPAGALVPRGGGCSVGRAATQRRPPPLSANERLSQARPCLQSSNGALITPASWLSVAALISALHLGICVTPVKSGSEIPEFYFIFSFAKLPG